MCEAMARHRKGWWGIELLEHRTLLSSNLGVGLGDLSADMPTGSTVNVPVTLTNQGATPLSGGVTVQVGLDDGSGSGSVVLGSQMLSKTIAGGGQARMTIPITIPAGARIGTDTIEAVATSSDGLTADTATGEVNVVWEFGTVPGLGRVTLTAADPNTGATGVFSISGPGMGTLSAPSGAWDMFLSDTTRASRVTVTGAVDLEYVSASNALGGLNAPQADFVAVAGHEADSLMIFDGLSSLVMHDCSAEAAGSHSITIGGDRSTGAVSLTFNNVNDLAVDSAMPISSFHAANVTAHTGTPYIRSHAYIGSVVISGDFTGVAGGVAYPEVFADSADPRNGYCVASVQIGGNLDSAAVTADHGALGQVRIGGSMDHDGQVYSFDDSVGNVWVGGNMDNGAEVFNANGGIKSVHVNGYMDHGADINIDDTGNIGPVWVGGGMNNGASVNIVGQGNIVGVNVVGILAGSIATNDGDVGTVSAASWDGGAVTATTASSVISKGDFDGSLTLTGSANPLSYTLGSAKIAGAVGSGTWDVAGRIGSISIGGDVGASDSAWVLQSATTVTALNLGVVVNADMNVEGGIAGLKAVSWAAGSIAAGSIGTLSVTGKAAVSHKTATAGAPATGGDFGANVSLTGNDLQGGPALRSATIAGNLDSLSWVVIGDMGVLTVGGVAGGTAQQPLTVQATQNIAGLTLGAAIYADFWAGMDDLSAQGRHAEPGIAFDDPFATIKSVNIRGWAAAKATTPAFFQDSNFSAANILTASITNALTDDTGTPSGLWARTIKSVRCTDNRVKPATTWTWPKAPGSPPGLTIQLV